MPSSSAAEGPRDGLTRDAVVVLYREHREDLYRLAWLLVGDAGVAEDMVHDVFARLWQRPELVHDPGRVEAYLRSMVLNGVRTRWSTARRRRRLDDRRLADRSSGDAHGDWTGRSDGTAAVDDRELLRTALDRLTAKQRTCTVCRYWLDLTDEQIAEATGMALGTVKTHLRRALTNLREDLGANAATTRHAVPAPGAVPAPVLDQGAP